MRTASKRSCSNCMKLQHTYYGCDIMVVPYYKSYIKTSRDPMSLSEYHNLVIAETFICPNCGEKVINEYTANLTQEDMQTMVDREVADKK